MRCDPVAIAPGTVPIRESMPVERVELIVPVSPIPSPSHSHRALARWTALTLLRNRLNGFSMTFPISTWLKPGVTVESEYLQLFGSDRLYKLQADRRGRRRVLRASEDETQPACRSHLHS